MSKKKIFIDATGIVNTPTGLGKYSQYLLMSLFNNQAFNFTVLHQKSLMSTHPLFPAKNTNIEFIPLEIPVLGPGREISMFKLRREINKCDLFHCLSSYLPAFGIRTHSIVTVHDLKYLLFPWFFNNRFKSLYYNWIIRRGIKNASCIITVSDATRHDIEKLGLKSRKIHVIHEASTISHNDINDLPKAISSKKFFLFVGENRSHKNIVRVIDAYRIARTKLGNQCPLFVFVGARYEVLKERYGDDKLIFLGSVSDGVLANLYNNAIALVFPSLYEGFGLPILEAMHMGTPVITSNCSAMPEVAGNAALLIDPQNTTQLAKAMLKLLLNAGERSKLRTLGFKRVKDFSWEKAAHEVSNLYEEIL